MSSLIQRLQAAWFAFRNAHQKPAYAVIYDSFEGLKPETDEPVEAYYERFVTPGEANRLFNTAFPKRERDMGATVAGSERLVLILGPIDEYKGAN